MASTGCLRTSDNAFGASYTTMWPALLALLLSAKDAQWAGLGLFSAVPATAAPSAFEDLLVVHHAQGNHVAVLVDDAAGVDPDAGRRVHAACREGADLDVLAVDLR